MTSSIELELELYDLGHFFYFFFPLKDSFFGLESLSSEYRHGQLMFLYLNSVFPIKACATITVLEETQ